jgi:GNAT superfamily N-acetyltransferase
VVLMDAVVSMSLRRVDVFDDAELERCHEVVAASERHERPYATPWSLQEERALYRAEDPAERRELWAVGDARGVTGVVLIELPLLDNTDMVWAEVHVDPDAAGRGFGSALVDLVIRRSTEEGRSTVLVPSAYAFERREDHPYRRFAERHGFALANTEMHRVLDLPVEEGLLRSMILEAAAHHRGYTIERYVDGVPPELLPTYCEVHNQLIVDAPTGEIEFEAEAVTPEIWLEREDQLRAARRLRSTVVALDGDRQVVGYSDVSIPLDDPENLHQWGTLVRRDHRGHRLGLALKARNLLEIQREYPGRRVVHTANAEVNENMIAINERLGFRPVEIFPEFLRRL